MKRRLTPQQQEFVRLVVEEGQTFTAAYRLAYPPRNVTRSRGAEQVAARRLAHRPLVEQRMEQLREELLASDPAEMRRRANAVLGRILAERLDPRYRRTAMDVLRYLDEQECSASSAGWEEYRSAATQIAALDAIEAGRKNVERSASGRPPRKPVHRELGIAGADVERAKELSIPLTPQAAQDAERRSAEILQVVSDRQGARFGEKPTFQMGREIDDQQYDSLPVVAPAVPAEGIGFRLERKPGHFGKGGWKRQPDSRPDHRDPNA
jgi:hypothetical protein